MSNVIDTFKPSEYFQSESEEEEYHSKSNKKEDD